MSKRRKDIYIIAVILILLSMSFLPFPTRNNQILHGSQVTKDGEIENNVVIKMHTWKLNYLLKSDKIKGNVKIVAKDVETEIRHFGNMFILEDAYIVTIMYYNVEENRMCNGRIFFDKEFSTIQINLMDSRMNSSYYVASENQYMNQKDILSSFSKYNKSAE